MAFVRAHVTAASELGEVVEHWTEAMDRGDEVLVSLAERRMCELLFEAGAIGEDHAIAVDRSLHGAKMGFVRVLRLSREEPSITMDLFRDGTVYAHGRTALH